MYAYAVYNVYIYIYIYVSIQRCKRSAHTGTCIMIYWPEIVSTHKEDYGHIYVIAHCVDLYLYACDRPMHDYIWIILWTATWFEDVQWKTAAFVNLCSVPCLYSHTASFVAKSFQSSLNHLPSNSFQLNTLPDLRFPKPGGFCKYRARACQMTQMSLHVSSS